MAATAMVMALVITSSESFMMSPWLNEYCMLAANQTGRAAYVQPSQLYGDVAITGEAGSGKSVMVHGFMQWAALARDHTDKRVWGKDTRIIVGYAVVIMRLWPSRCASSPPNRVLRSALRVGRFGSNHHQ